MSAEPIPVLPTATEPVAVDASSKVPSTEPATTAVKATDSTTAETTNPTVGETSPLTANDETPDPGKSSSEKKTVDFVEVKSPMENILAELPAIIKDVGHGEMWGVKLSDINHVPTTVVLEKFLRANNQNGAEATVQLKKALKWRKETNPAKLLADVEFDSTKFGDLGYVTSYPQADGSKEIVTWNIYGSVKNFKATFGDVEEFLRWRSALMELSVRELDLSSATVKIPEGGVDPYRMIQVHDYLNVSFLRMDPSVKAASKHTIEIMSMAYPELLKEKFFVNVPLVMGWVFAGMKLFLSAETVKKFHPLSYGSNLAGELPTFGKDLPTVYGGKGKDVKEGLSVKYTTAVETAEKK